MDAKPIVVVTGGSGYLAGFVIAELLNHGYAVRTSLRSLGKLSSIKAALTSWVSDAVLLGDLTAFQADLTSADGWDAGFTGAAGLIHVASPLGHGTETAEELTRVAKAGTEIVIRAAANSGVHRVVVTGSQAACTAPSSAGAVTLDESFFSDPNNPELDPYRVSKVYSEQAAWDLAGKFGLDLAVVLPGAIFGPSMAKYNISANSILLGLLKGQFPAALKVDFEVSDVRDLAVLHRLALERPEAVGERFLAGSQVISMPQVAALYREYYPQAKAPRRTFPNWMVKVIARFVPELRSMVPMLGRTARHSTAKAENLLGWKQHTPEQTVLDAADSLVKLGALNS